jgi:hypothetical protein
LPKPPGIALGQAKIEADGAAVDITECGQRVAKHPRRQTECGSVSIRNTPTSGSCALSCASAGIAAQNQTAKAAQTCFIR